MDDATQACIFDAVFHHQGSWQGHRPRAAAVYGIVKQHEGRIELRVIYSSGYSSDLFAGKVELKEGLNYLAKLCLLAALEARPTQA